MRSAFNSGSRATDQQPISSMLHVPAFHCKSSFYIHAREAHINEPTHRRLVPLTTGLGLFISIDSGRFFHMLRSAPE